MKYIAYWEYDFGDVDKVLEKLELYMEEVEKFPQKYPKELFPEHETLEGAKGFVIIEATPDQLINEALFWLPELKYKFVPIFEGAKVVEAYKKLKK